MTVRRITDSRHQRTAQQPEVNPHGTVALRAGLAIGVGIVVGGSVVVVAVSPTCIPDVLVNTGGVVEPAVSTPSAAPAVPAAMSAAPTTITARILIDFCMKVPLTPLCSTPWCILRM
jgi:hypothetical protein